jgi:hypothetical protein
VAAGEGGFPIITDNLQVFGAAGLARVFTATPVINRGKWCYLARLSEFGPPFLNGLQRSVNRKVQGSNPCPGANFVGPISNSKNRRVVTTKGLV